MTISLKSIRVLSLLIAGDSNNTPYLSGPRLVEFYNSCGFNDSYGEGFGTRWRYSQEKLLEANGTGRMKTIIEEYLDPRRFAGDLETVNKLAGDINTMLKYEDFALVKDRKGLYRVTGTKEGIVEAKTTRRISHEFVQEQISKCAQKIEAEDYNGSITNARTLVEAVLIHIIETVDKADVKNDGNVLNLYRRAKQALKIDFSKDELPDYVFQILAGLDTSLTGLAGLSNNAADRHATKFRTKRHHARLAVNTAMSLCDFLIDVLNERRNTGN